MRQVAVAWQCGECGAADNICSHPNRSSCHISGEGSCQCVKSGALVAGQAKAVGELRGQLARGAPQPLLELVSSSTWCVRNRYSYARR